MKQMRAGIVGRLEQLSGRFVEKVPDQLTLIEQELPSPMTS
ncbi:MAG: hypothetical protein M5R40_20595 [Anaerolineae bacterium]|nr:hypothetical protein [Anaerolineae bacterium]